jgi:hypothetical protein
MWSPNTGDCLIEVITWAGLTRFILHPNTEDWIQ